MLVVSFYMDSYVDLVCVWSSHCGSYIKEIYIVDLVWTHIRLKYLYCSKFIMYSS